MNTAKSKLRTLTAADSEVHVQAYILDGAPKLLIDGCDVSIEEACKILQIDISELKFQLFRHGFPGPDDPWRSESLMLQSYASEYIAARNHLRDSMDWSLPFLYLTGHAYELILKCAMSVFLRIRIRDIKKMGHDLSGLRDKILPKLYCGIKWPFECTSENANLIKEFDEIYSREYCGSRFFVRYPHIDHLYGKWPENIERAVELAVLETDITMDRVIAEFRVLSWPYSTKHIQNFQDKSP
jgi:hypothetical protein